MFHVSLLFGGAFFLVSNVNNAMPYSAIYYLHIFHGTDIRAMINIHIMLVYNLSDRTIDSLVV